MPLNYTKPTRLLLKRAIRSTTKPGLGVLVGRHDHVGAPHRE